MKLFIDCVLLVLNFVSFLANRDNFISILNAVGMLCMLVAILVDLGVV